MVEAYEAPTKRIASIAQAAVIYPKVFDDEKYHKFYPYFDLLYSLAGPFNFLFLPKPLR
jgi:hypothetical protein